MANRGNTMMGEMPMGKLVAKMSVPLMISMLIQSLYNVVDSIFVSRLGMEAISAIGMAFPVQMLIIAIANGVGVGMNALIAQCFGRGEGEKAGRAAGNGLLISLIVAAGFFLFGFLGTGVYFRFCTDDASIIQYGMDYLSIVCMGSIGHLMGIFGERMLQVTGKTTLSMLTQIAGAATNIILDPILIFGLLGAPRLGIRGAAIATILGLMVSAAVGLSLHAKVNTQLRFHWSDVGLSRDAVEIIKVGLPVSLTMAIGSLMTFGMNRILREHITAIAVFTVYYRLQTLLFMPIQGMMQGMIPIVGYNYGAKKGERLREAIVLGAKICAAIMVTGLVVLELIPGPVFSLFADKDSPEMLSMGVRALRIISLTFPVSGVALVLSNIFQGMGNGTPSMVFGALRQCVFLLPGAWLLLRLYGVNGVWFAFLIAEFLTAGVVWFLFHREYRRRVKPLMEDPGQTETLP